MKFYNPKHPPGKQLDEKETMMTRVLVVNSDLTMRKILVGFLRNQADTDKCYEADSIETLSVILENEPVDFSIVDFSIQKNECQRMAELIKLRCPNLPMLIVSANPHKAESPVVELLNNSNQCNKLSEAIQYVRSLTGSGLKGFTVAVDI